MKKLLIALLFITINSYAAEECNTSAASEEVKEKLEIKTDVPKHLEGATITVKLKDGRETTVPAERFKVVPRLQQFITTKTQVSTSTVCKSPTKKHRVSVLAGKAPKTGVATDNSNFPNKVAVESRYGTNTGLQYQYKTDTKILGHEISVGGQVQSNDSAAGVIGLEF